MEVKIDCLIPFEIMIKDPDSVFQIVETHGSVVILKNNQPQYIIQKYSPKLELHESKLNVSPTKHTLQVAMQIVLQEAENHAMHAADLAEAIYARGLYRQKDGGKAGYNQVRARCGHYPDLFEVIPKNIIRLK